MRTELHAFLAVRADAPEQDIVAGERKAVGITDSFFQTGYIFHIHIEHPSALFAADMAVVVAPVIKAVCASRNLHFAYFPHF